MARILKDRAEFYQFIFDGLVKSNSAGVVASKMLMCTDVTPGEIEKMLIIYYKDKI